MRGHHPGKPGGFGIRRIVGADDLWVTEYVITYEDKPLQTISIMEFRDGKVIHETQYFAEPFEAPAWRSRWVERAVDAPGSKRYGPELTSTPESRHTIQPASPAAKSGLAEGDIIVHYDLHPIFGIDDCTGS